MKTTVFTPLMPGRPRRSPLGVLRAPLAYAGGEAVAAFRRNGLMSAAAVTTIMVTLLPVGGAVALAANLRLMTTILERQVQGGADLRDGISPQERDRLPAPPRGLPRRRPARGLGP